MRTITLLGVLLLAFPAAPAITAQERYRVPPKDVVDIVDARPLPAVSLDPTNRLLLHAARESLPTIAAVSAPMLRLAGARINPKNHAPHLAGGIAGIGLQSIDGGDVRWIDLPKGVRSGAPNWSPDGKRFAFLVYGESATELWLCDRDAKTPRRLIEAPLSATGGPSFVWMPDSNRLIVRLRLAGAEPPLRPTAPEGPIAQETSGRTAPVRTFQDMLQNPHDERLFEYYFTAQLAMVGLAGDIAPLGEPAVWSNVEPSPDGAFLLTTRRVRPWSYQVPMQAFPSITEIRKPDFTIVREVARQGLLDNIPIEGVPTGPRSIDWRSDQAATLVWTEALDGGDPKSKVPHRDRWMTLAAPFEGEPREVLKTEHRLMGTRVLEDGRAMVGEYDRDRKWTRTWLVSATAGEAPRLLWERNTQDRYKDPGEPVTEQNAYGRSVVKVANGALLLIGRGATPAGDRPFLDRMNLESGAKERLWQCEGECLESVVEVLADDASLVLTRHETPREPPNYYLRALGAGQRKKLTDFKDAALAIHAAKKELVTYERKDGVKLSATMYVPANRRDGERLPLIVWAYPLEYTDAATAGQISGSPYQYSPVGGASHLLFLLQGYAVMDGATMPVVGPPETANDTFIAQITSSAEAAIEKAVAMGIADRDRVAVGGHSYGAFMTAHLLAHTDLFRAGIARSGAYNRTLTPFGFQSERRTYWEAPAIYQTLSPFTHANKINEPLLLIHGTADSNPGTFPIQSERLYAAVKGHGGTTRLVLLPDEDHGYRARESVLHTVAEMFEWCEKHVKAPRQ